jgi:hypothetical protein
MWLYDLPPAVGYETRLARGLLDEKGGGDTIRMNQTTAKFDRGVFV